MEQSKEFKYKPKLNRHGYLKPPLGEFIQYHKKNSEDNTITDFKLVKAILESIFTKIWFYMITELWIFKTPNRMGMFYIAEDPRSGGFFKNWQKSRKAGKLVYDYNLETSGIRPFLRWNKFTCSRAEYRMYKFVAFRGVKEKPHGYRGLWGYVKKLANDPFKKNYRGHII